MADTIPLPDHLVQMVRAVAQTGGTEACRHFRRSLAIDNKLTLGGFDPVTEGDRRAETVMRAMIEAEFPEHGILGEEFGEKESASPWRWVLDPIDGTRGFMSGIPMWTTLVGLEHERVPVAGAIFQPFTGELWLTTSEGTAYEGAEPLKCQTSSVKTLAEARLATTDPRPAPQGYFSLEEAESFRALGQACRVARFSLDAYAYGALTLGQLDLVVESGLQRYDVAALIPILKGAGAVISSWDGGEASDGGRVVAAATAELHRAALAYLS